MYTFILFLNAIEYT